MRDENVRVNPTAFISYSHEDRDRFVLPFARLLRENGVNAWVDEWELLPGDSIVNRIFEEGLKTAKAIIVVLSRHSVSSKWVREELDAAMVAKINRGSRLIPVVLEECEVPEALRATKWVKVKSLEEMEAPVAEVVAAVFENRRRPELGPPPAYASATTVKIGNLNETDTAVLSLVYENALSSGQLSTEFQRVVTQCEGQGLEVSQVRDSAEILADRGYLENSSALGKGIVSIRVTHQGMVEYLEASLPNYSELTAQAVLLIVNEGIRGASELAEAIGQPVVVANTILEQLERRFLVRLSSSLSPSHRVTIVRAGLRRVAGEIGT